MVEMATLMRLCSYGLRPYCEVALDNGDRVLVTMDASGVVMKRLARADIPEETLFVGSVHVVSEICTSLLNGRQPLEITVLDIFLAMVSQFRSAADVKAAFAEATARL